MNVLITDPSKHISITEPVHIENIFGMCSEVNLWPVFPRAPCLEKIQRRLTVIWPVQTV